MRSRPFFVLVAICAFAGFGAAQRSVTNADLQGYRDQRVRAETDLRENYSRLGFPSPDEMARRDDERNKRRDELAASIRQHELEEAKLAMQYQYALEAIRAQQPQQVVMQEDPFQAGRLSTPFDSYAGYAGYGGYYGYGSLNNGWIRGGRRRGGVVFGGSVRPQVGYYAGGQYWPQSVSPPQRPVPWAGAAPRPHPQPHR